MSDILTAFSGAKRSDSGGRTVVDKLYGLKGNLNPVFAGADRPEFTDYNGFESVDVEKESENLLNFSEKFDGSYWNKSSSGTGFPPVVTPNDTISPKGDLKADRIDFDRGSGDTADDTSLITSGGISVVEDEVFSNSLWLKAATPADVGKEIGLRHMRAIEYEVITLTDGWVRYNITEIVTVDDSSRSVNITSRGTTTADNQVSLHIWGIQLEKSPYPTNYIPTQGSPVTRLAPSPVIENALPETGALGWVGKVVRDDSTSGRIYSTSENSNNRLLIHFASDHFRISCEAKGTDNRILVTYPFGVDNNNFHDAIIIQSWTIETLYLWLCNTEGEMYGYTEIGDYDRSSLTKDLRLGHETPTSIRTANLKLTTKVIDTVEKAKSYIEQITAGSFNLKSSEITLMNP